MNSDEPFHNPNAAPRNPQSTFSSGQLPPHQLPPKKSNPWLWVLGTLGVLTIVGGLVCCGGGYYLFQMAQGMIGDQIKNQVAEDPTIQEHIGEIASIKMNYSQTAAAIEEKPDAIAFDIAGDKGTGVLVVQQDKSVPGETYALRSAELILPNGDRHQLIPADNADAAIESSIDDPTIVEEFEMQGS
ncbi:hypothetical protein Q31b_21540 [Novipirellula aureliae]|uniref:Cytochrome oxidase complex assembly protein 1 n=1 Tax=Novipirellula aureliae TaxID=2527966 RepID=A0A5C6E594_9BACT|nr:hypothetical protein [Novipirellula aureliae]TWU43117.1 hypothetical protein Q31b_21540 [Novipirellula aureliae]